MNHFQNNVTILSTISKNTTHSSETENEFQYVPIYRLLLGSNYVLRSNLTHFKFSPKSRFTNFFYSERFITGILSNSQEKKRNIYIHLISKYIIDFLFLLFGFTNLDIYITHVKDVILMEETENFELLYSSEIYGLRF